MSQAEQALRIAFFGTPAPAVPSLRALLDDPEVTVPLVVTNPDRPRGRGHQLAAPAVKEEALAADVKVRQPRRPGELLAELGDLRLDACAVVAYGALLPADVLAAGGRGFVNLHFSLLPAWRGAAPVPHTLLAGEKVTGVTCFVLDEGMDTGPVLIRERTGLRPGETAGELTSRLAVVGAPVLATAVKGFARGELSAQPQTGPASYAPKLTPDDARVDWRAAAEVIERAVRAFNPVPGAHTTFQGGRLKIHRAQVTQPTSDDEADGAGREPGRVVGLRQGMPVVACGRGWLRLDEVQPAGKTRMDGVAFVNGYRPIGARLGEP